MLLLKVLHYHLLNAPAACLSASKVFSATPTALPDRTVLVIAGSVVRDLKVGRRMSHMKGAASSNLTDAGPQEGMKMQRCA